jgi:hypothetical protein
MCKILEMQVMAMDQNLYVKMQMYKWKPLITWNLHMVSKSRLVVVAFIFFALK